MTSVKPSAQTLGIDVALREHYADRDDLTESFAFWAYRRHQLATRTEGARIWNAWTAIIALLVVEQAMNDSQPYRWREYLGAKP